MSTRPKSHSQMEIHLHLMAPSGLDEQSKHPCLLLRGEFANFSMGKEVVENSWDDEKGRCIAVSRLPMSCSELHRIFAFHSLSWSHANISSNACLPPAQLNTNLAFVSWVKDQLNFSVPARGSVFVLDPNFLPRLLHHPTHSDSYDYGSEHRSCLLSTSANNTRWVAMRALQQRLSDTAFGLN